MSIDNQILLAAAIAIVGLGTGVYSFYKFRDLNKSFEIWLTTAQRQEVKTVLETQFGRLEPEIQAHILKLINVADPLTILTPSHLDDRVVQWLKSITDKNPNT